jgi:cytochrome c oxidase assembly factor CtaG
MSDALRDIFADWEFPVWLTLSLVVTGAVYLRGWLKIRKTRPDQFTTVQLGCFLGGLAVFWVSVGSPMDGLADALLSAHMVEHLLIMSVVPPLLLFGLPVVPLLRGLPSPLQKWVVGPMVRSNWLRRFGHWLVKPLVAWLAMNIAFLGWHFPAAYNFALEHENWHVVEHLCFLTTSILFWWYVLQPWPAERRRRNWGVLLYLVSADIVNTMLSASLAFSDRPIFSYYTTHPNPFQVSPVDDQVLGAVIMWVLGSMVFLIPAMLMTMRMLRPSRLTKMAERRVGVSSSI